MPPKMAIAHRLRHGKLAHQHVRQKMFLLTEPRRPAAKMDRDRYVEVANLSPQAVELRIAIRAACRSDGSVSAAHLVPSAIAATCADGGLIPSSDCGKAGMLTVRKPSFAACRSSRSCFVDIAHR